MTTLQMVAFTCAYAVVLAAVVYFTHPTGRRVAGALTGGAAAGCLGIGAIALGQSIGVWQVPLPTTPGSLTLFYLCFAVSMSPIYLVTWRVARRFGWIGLAICLVIVAVIGPPRDYLYAAIYPAWMVFGPGVAPILADAAAYVGMVAVGHAVMRAVAGPARVTKLVV